MLEDIAEVANVEEAVLKMGCEGCEYDIGGNDYSSLELFKELGIECRLRHGSLKVLLNKLSKDFKCKACSYLSLC
jgi:hypothetical protein